MGKPIDPVKKNPNSISAYQKLRRYLMILRSFLFRERLV